MQYSTVYALDFMLGFPAMGGHDSQWSIDWEQVKKKDAWGTRLKYCQVFESSGGALGLLAST